MHDETGALQVREAEKAGEPALVFLDRTPIGFTYVEANRARATIDLLTRAVFLHPLPSAPDLDEPAHCGCLPDELEPGTVQPEQGAAWALGVRICLTHGLLRPA